MSKLEEIYGLLPDNNEGAISEKDVRDAFSKTFDQIDESLENLEEDTRTAIGNINSKKLPKTQITIQSPNAEFKYIYLTNEQNETRRMPAGNIGSNIANATLTTTQNAGVIQGAYYIWNINSYGLTFNVGEEMGLGETDTSIAINSDEIILSKGNNNGYSRMDISNNRIDLYWRKNNLINMHRVSVTKFGVSIEGFANADNDDTFDRQVVTKPNGILATKTITKETLETVVNRGNYCPEDIVFREGEANVEAYRLGVDIDTSSSYFGSFSRRNQGNFNLSFGIGALQNNFTGAQNTAIGAYALSKNMDGNYNLAIGTSSLQNLENDDTTDDVYKNNNVAIGVYSGYSLLKSGRNTLLGKDTAKNVKTLFCSTFIGSGSGYALNYTGSEDRTTVGFIKSKSPILGNSWYMGKNVGGLQYFGIDPNTSETDYSTSMGMNTLVGSNIADSTTAPRRMYASTVIGVNPLWNCTTNFFNNILIGAGNYFKYTGQEINNSIIIGNFNYLLNADNILCIHNSVNTQENITDGLIYGSFKERWLKINGQLKLDLNRTANAEENDFFNKILTIDLNGDIGYRSLLSLPDIQKMLIIIDDQRATIMDLQRRVTRLENHLKNK